MSLSPVSLVLSIRLSVLQAPPSPVQTTRTLSFESIHETVHKLSITSCNTGAEGVSVLFFSALIFCFDLLRVIYGLFIHGR